MCCRAAIHSLIPDWLVIDHYGIDAVWEKQLRSSVGQIFVIDDLANRQHDCDVLLDQNVLADQAIRYKDLVDSHCKLLLGSKYLLLRSQFSKARIPTENTPDNPQSVLIFMGGGDPDNWSVKIAEVVRELDADLRIDLLVGAANERYTELFIKADN